MPRSPRPELVPRPARIRHSSPALAVDDRRLLVCVTEQNTQTDIDHLAAVLRSPAARLAAQTRSRTHEPPHRPQAARCGGSTRRAGTSRSSSSCTAPGERGVLVSRTEPACARPSAMCVAALPASLRRTAPPALPEIGQMRVLKHYLRLSQENLGADLNVDVGQGTCTMKYAPKVNEAIIRTPDLTELHPLQDQASVQGVLEIIWTDRADARRDLRHEPGLAADQRRVRGDLGEHLDDPRLPRVARRGRAARRGDHDDLLPPVERGGRQGRRATR